MDATESRIIEQIDRHRDEIIAFARDIYTHAELGYKEFRTSQKAKEFLEKLGLKVEDGFAITGVKGYLNPEKKGNTSLALIGEMDALRIPEHKYVNPETQAAHCCGHHAQLAGIIEGRINCDELLVQSRKALSGATTEGALLAVQEPKKTAKRSAKKADIIAEISEFFDANLDDGQSVPRKATQADELPVVQPPQQQSEEMPAGFYF